MTEQNREQIHSHEVGSMDWFRIKAQKSLSPISDGLWDFSDSALLYNPQGVEAYSRAQEQEADYKNLTDQESELIASVAPRLVEGLPGDFSYIDLGPGTKHKEKYLFDEAKKQGKNFIYYPVDISQEILDSSRNFAVAEGLEARPIHGTFEEVPENLSQSTGYRFVSLGMTYANYDPPEILNLLKQIMGKQGSAFVNIQPRDRIDIEKVKHAYDSPSVRRMLEQKLQLLGISQDEIESIEVTDDICIYAKLKSVTAPGLARRGLRSGDRMLLIKTYRPTLENFKNEASRFFKVNVFDTGSEFVAARLDHITNAEK